MSVTGQMVLDNSFLIEIDQVDACIPIDPQGTVRSVLRSDKLHLIRAATRIK